MSPFLSAYFARTGWQQPVQVNIDTLRWLHLHHNCAIPFENIDVVLPREIHLDDGCLVDKLVTARRGILLRAKRSVRAGITRSWVYGTQRAGAGCTGESVADAAAHAPVAPG